MCSSKCLKIFFASLFIIFFFSCNHGLNNEDKDYETLFKTWKYSEFNNDTLSLVPGKYEYTSMLKGEMAVFTFYKNKEFIEFGYGPADRIFKYKGLWSKRSEDSILITFNDNQSNKPQDYIIEIIELKEDLLKIKKTIL